MALILVNEMLLKAINEKDYKLLGCTLDVLRTKGERYSDLVARVLKLKPEMTEAEVDALFALADEADAS